MNPAFRHNPKALVILSFTFELKVSVRQDMRWIPSQHIFYHNVSAQNHLN